MNKRGGLWFLVVLFLLFTCLFFPMLFMFHVPPATPGMRARLRPIYLQLQQVEASARANHIADTQDPALKQAEDAVEKLQDSLPRHLSQPDDQAASALDAYEADIQGLVQQHLPAQRAQLTADDAKTEEQIHKTLTTELDRRLNKPSRFALPVAFYSSVKYLIPLGFLVFFPVVMFFPFRGPLRTWRMQRRLRRVGVPAIGIVADVESAGLVVNGIPMLRLKVLLDSGETVEVVQSMIGAASAGQSIQLLIDPEDHSKAMAA